MSKNQHLQDLLLSKTIYSQFLDLVSDSDPQTSKDAIKSVVEAGKYHPVVLINLVLQRLDISVPTYSQEYFCAYIELLREFFKVCPRHIHEDDLNTIYTFLKIVIIALIKPSAGQTSPTIFKASQEPILQMIRELSYIYPKKHLDFLLSFLNYPDSLDSLVITLFLQLKQTSPKVIPEHILDVLDKVFMALSTAKTDETKFKLADFLVDMLELSAKYQDDLALTIDFSLLNRALKEIRHIIEKDWLQSRNNRLRVTTLYSIGLMVSLMPTKEYLDDTHTEATTKLFIDSLSKESKEDHAKILKGLNLIVEKYSRLTDKNNMKALVANVLLALHPLLITPLFSKNLRPNQQRTEYKNELAETISILGEYFPNQLFDYFIQKVVTTNSNKLEIISSLWIIASIIQNYNSKLREHLKKVFLSHLQSILDYDNHEMQYAILENIYLIVIMKFPKLDDSKVLLDFLVSRMLENPNEIKVQDSVKNEGLDTTVDSVILKANDVFTLIAHNVNGVSFLWPKILSYTMLPAFSPKLPFILENLYVLLSKDEENESLIHSTSNTPEDVVQLHRLLLRCLILCYVPNAFPSLGYTILNVIPLLFRSLLKNIPTSSTFELAQLLSQVPPPKNYFEKLEAFIFHVISQISQLDSYPAFKEAVFEAFSFYSTNIELLGAVCVIYGMILNQMGRINDVLPGLEKLFSTCHCGFAKNVINESLGCQATDIMLRNNVSRAVGIVAINHFGPVIEFIEQIYSDLSKIPPKKQKNLMSLFIASKDDNIKDDLLITLTQSLGYASYYSKPNNFIKKYDAIFEILLVNLDSSRLKESKTACAKALSDLSLALFRASEQPEINTPSFREAIVEMRETIFTKMIKVQVDEKIQELHIHTYKTQAFLSRIDPPLSEKFYFGLFRELLSLFPLTYSDSYANFAEAFGEVIYTIIWKNEIRSISEGTLQILSFWGNFSQYEEYKNTLRKIFLENILRALTDKQIQDPSEKDVPFLIKSVVEILSYVMVDNENIKHLAAVSIFKLLKEDYNDFYNTQTLELGVHLLESLKDKYGGQTITSQFIKLLAENRNSKDVSIFVGFNRLFRVLYTDNHLYVKDDLRRLLESFFDIFDHNSNGKTSSKAIQNEMMENIVHMMRFHLQEILDIMLRRKCEFPLASSLSVFLHNIAQDNDLLINTFNYVTNILNNPEHVNSPEINTILFNATIFFGVLMEAKSEFIDNLVHKFFSEILGTYLLRLATCFDNVDLMTSTLEKGAFKFALWSFQKFLACAEEKSILSYVEGIKSKRESLADIEEVLCGLVMMISKASEWKKLKALIQFLIPFQSKLGSSQHCLVIVVIAQTIYSSIFLKEFTDEKTVFFEDFTIFETWIRQLLQILLQNFDTNVEMIRKYCLQGLGNTFYLSNLKENPRVMESHVRTDGLCALDQTIATSLLNILVKGIQDDSILCIREALGSFLRMLTLFDLHHLENQIETICTRLRELLESEDAQVRMATLNFMGKLFNLLQMSELESKQRLHKEIHSSVVQILVHLQDDSGAAKQACIVSLNEIGKALDMPELSALLNNSQELPANNQLLDKEEKLLFDIMKAFCDKFWGRASIYFYSALQLCHNEKEYIRSTAVFLLLIWLNLVDVSKVSVERKDIEGILVKCLGDQSQKVKRKVLKGFALLSDLHKKLDMNVFSEDNEGEVGV